ncbi:putative vacuolar protein sorting-associated protein 13B [Contarinia nasturtii]|uniref:putative vacuolar protein sorting-associated protein 13B n=1 Tax=Contarinia nasturtii TaxID=265458 RepID=UPI0012D4AB35|nr:putative vacuolar protein sorting-associated protein 13B [Contarinia nasturtii]
MAVVENIARAADLEVQDDALQAAQDLYIQALVALETRIETLETEAEERDREREVARRNEERQNGTDENIGNPDQENANGAAFNNNDLGGIQHRPRMERDDFLLDHFKPPKFNGSYAAWTEWRSAYDSMIHNSTLNPTRKLYLLKQCLVGNAERVLSGWQVVGESYAEAYNTLCAVYENNYRIIMSYLDQLFNMPRLQQETHDGIRLMIDTTNSVIRQLRVRGSPVNDWDQVIVHTLLSRMAPRSLAVWEETEEGNEMPSVQNVLDFLTKRARAQLNREQIQPSNRNNNGGQSNSNNEQNRVENSSGNSNSKQSITQHGESEPQWRISCNNCQLLHPMFRCSSFLEMSVPERQNRVRELNLCSNCFSNGHKAGAPSCKMSPCKRCNRGLYHNTLLCSVPMASSNALAVNNWQIPTWSEQPHALGSQPISTTVYQPPGIQHSSLNPAAQSYFISNPSDNQTGVLSNNPNNSNFY